MYLYDLVGKMVKINNEGPESRIGRLLSVERDYLILNTKEDGVVYYNAQHVKSVAELEKDDGRHLNDDPTYIRAFNFGLLLRPLEGEHIQINRGGPDKLEGRVAGFGPGFLLLETKKENIRVPIFHIKNVSIKGNGNGNGEKDQNKRNNGNRSNRRGSKGRSSQRSRR